jgi:hypothetical protein
MVAHTRGRYEDGCLATLSVEPRAVDLLGSTRPLGRIGIIIPFSAAQVRNTRKMAISAGFIDGYVGIFALRSGREEKFWK